MMKAGTFHYLNVNEFMASGEEPGGGYIVIVREDGKVAQVSYNVLEISNGVVLKQILKEMDAIPVYVDTNVYDDLEKGVRNMMSKLQEGDINGQ